VDTVFKNALFISQKVKDGVADHFFGIFKKRPYVDTKLPQVEIGIHLDPLAVEENQNQKETATFLLDLCGISLNQRGYRPKHFAAPLRENLAATLIECMDQELLKKGFIDSMTGSG